MSVHLPYLKSWDTVPVTVRLTDGFSSSGAPNVTLTYTGACRFAEKTKTLRKSDGTLIESAASLTICGDIAPGLSLLTGSTDVNGRTWQIVWAKRPRNPDGSVHHTELILI